MTPSQSGVVVRLCGSLFFKKKKAQQLTFGQHIINLKKKRGRAFFFMLTQGVCTVSSLFHAPIPYREVRETLTDKSLSLSYFCTFYFSFKLIKIVESTQSSIRSPNAVRSGSCYIITLHEKTWRFSLLRFFHFEKKKEKRKNVSINWMLIRIVTK